MLTIQKNDATLYLIRNDIERTPDLELPELSNGWHGDWKDLLGYRYWYYLRLWQITNFALGKIIPASNFAVNWDKLTKNIIYICIKKFYASKIIVSARPHGHILTSLLEI